MILIILVLLGNSLYKILGFDQLIYDHNIGVANVAPNKAHISNGVNALSVNCSLIDTRWNMSNATKTIVYIYYL